MGIFIYIDEVELVRRYDVILTTSYHPGYQVEDIDEVRDRSDEIWARYGEKSQIVLSNFS